MFTAKKQLKWHICYQHHVSRQIGVVGRPVAMTTFKRRDSGLFQKTSYNVSKATPYNASFHCRDRVDCGGGGGTRCPPRVPPLGLGLGGGGVQVDAETFKPRSVSPFTPFPRLSTAAPFDWGQSQRTKVRCPLITTLIKVSGNFGI